MSSAWRLFIALLLASVITGCRSRNEPAGATGTAEQRACPSEAFIEELHASAFHFQHGPNDVARDHLQRARASLPGHTDATSAKIIGQLAEISRRVDSDSNWAQRETESVRVEFGDWACLPESTHKRFHAKLPPLR